MAVKFSIAVGNGRLDQVEVTIGVSAVLKIRTGAPPANADAADTGTVLATMNLPSDWMAAAASRAKAKSGTWQDLLADAAGTAAHFRIYASNGTTPHIQGTCSITGAGGDMTLDNDVIALNQVITVTAFTLTDGNA